MLASGVQTSFELSIDSIFTNGSDIVDVGEFEIINSGNTALVVNSITSNNGLLADWSGSLAAGGRKKISIQNLRRLNFNSGRISVRTNAGNKYIFVSNSCPTAEYNSEAFLCESGEIAFGDLSITKPGEYSYAFLDQIGCDSTVNLTVSSVNLSKTVVLNGFQLVAQESNATSYQWYACVEGELNPVSGAQNRVFSPSSIGEYAVEVTKNGCSVFSECVQLEEVLSVDPEAESLELYPNPTQGQVNLRFQKPITGTITVCDVSGKNMYETEVNSSADMLLDLHNFKSGVYFVRMTGSDNATRKLVVR